MWVDYDVMENGVKGMRIHTEFEVYNMKGVAGVFGLYFQYKNGAFLRDNNNKFVSVSGEVVVHLELTPCCNPSTWYKDLALFMPYDELDLPGGKYDLQINPQVLYPNGGTIGLFPLFDFVFTQPAKNADATFSSAWVDYDVREAGEKGMRVHVKFSTTNMRAVDAKVAVFLQKRTGNALYSDNSTYNVNGTRAGELAGVRTIRPDFDNTDFNDLSFFIPYSELKSALPRGAHDLKMDIDVLNNSGALIKHLTMQDFWFEY
jgi:hypothetical protein